MFLLLLDAVGGMLMAFVLFILLRLLKSKKYKYKFDGVITESHIKDGKMIYTVKFSVDEKEQTRSYSLNLSNSTKQQISQIENFTYGFRKGSKFNLMCESKDASTEVIPNDTPIKSFVFFLVLLLIFHTIALLTKGSLFFALPL